MLTFLLFYCFTIITAHDMAVLFLSVTNAILMNELKVEDIITTKFLLIVKKLLQMTEPGMVYPFQDLK